MTIRLFKLLLIGSIIGLVVWKYPASYDGLAPWEKIPESSTLTYLYKWQYEQTTNPLYICIARFEDEEDVGVFTTAFGLTETSKEVRTTDSLPLVLPEYFNLSDSKRIYSYPARRGYLCNLWINDDDHLLLIERGWY